MKKIEGVEIFKAGTHRDADGDTQSYTQSDINEMADSYNTDIHEAPIVWGHDGDKAWNRHLKKSTQLSNGWVIKPYVKGSSLLTDIDVDDDTYEAITDGKLKKRSVGLYEPNSPKNPAPGKWYIRHVALLGTEPPAIKGLKDIKIFEEGREVVYNVSDETEEDNMEPEEAIKLLNENIKDWLAAALQDDGAGFGEKIIDFKPEPSEENDWLWNEEEQKYAGDILTDRGQVFAFEIAKDGDNWKTVTKMKTDEEGNEMIPENEEMELMEDKAEIIDTEEEKEAIMAEEPIEEEIVEEVLEDALEMGEGCCGDKMAEEMGEKAAGLGDTPEEKEALYYNEKEYEAMKLELAEMREEMAKYREKGKKDRKEMVLKFSESLYADGVLTEGTYGQENLNSLLFAALEANETSPIVYSEGEKEINIVEGLQSLLSSLPQIVQFNEATMRAVNDEVVKKSTPKAFGNVTKDSATEYSKIKKYQEENGIGSFLQAKRLMYTEES